MTSLDQTAPGINLNADSQLKPKLMEGNSKIFCFSYNLPEQKDTWPYAKYDLKG